MDDQPKHSNTTSMKILKCIDDYIVIICMVVLTILAILSVISRYVWNFSIAGTEEILIYLFLWASLFGASSGFKENAHGNIPIITNLLPKKLQYYNDILVVIGTIVFFSIFLWASFKVMYSAFIYGQTSSITNIPRWIVASGVTIAVLCCIGRNIVKLKQLITKEHHLINKEQ